MPVQNKKMRMKMKIKDRKRRCWYRLRMCDVTEMKEI